MTCSGQRNKAGKNVSVNNNSAFPPPPRNIDQALGINLYDYFSFEQISQGMLFSFTDPGHEV